MSSALIVLSGLSIGIGITMIVYGFVKPSSRGNAAVRSAEMALSEEVCAPSSEVLAVRFMDELPEGESGAVVLEPSARAGTAEMESPVAGGIVLDFRAIEEIPGEDRGA